MKKLGYGLVCLLALVACTPVMAITIDGDISDWDSASIHTEGVDNSGGVELIASGCKLEDGYLKAFVQIADNPVAGYFMSNPGVKNLRIIPGAWIDVDHSTATLAAGNTHQGSWPGSGNAGIDINFEWGGGTYPAPSQYPECDEQYFWGPPPAGVDAHGSTWITNGAKAYTPYNSSWNNDPNSVNYFGNTPQVMEWACSWSDFVSEMNSYGTAQVKSYMIVGMAIQGTTRGWTGSGNTGTIFNATGYGYDYMVTFPVAVLPGDANDDGTANFSDYLVISQNFGTAAGATWEMGDSNFDGAVNFSDYLALSQNFGGTRGGAVPEPVSLALLGLGALLLRRKA